MLDPQFENLSVAERLQLIGDLWESVSASPAALVLTPEQEEELDRRIDDFEKNPDDGIPWEEVRKRLTKA
jgi:putative addiction module component (TIGR02574 family)